MNFLKAFEIIVAHYSDLVALVAVAENLYPASGAGADKLKWVHDQLAANQEIVAKVGSGDLTALWPFVDKVIATVVSLALKKVTKA